MKKLYAISLPVIVLCSLFLPSINRAGVLGMLRPMALGGTSSAERNAKEAGSDLAKLNRRVVALAKTLNDDGLLADEEIRGKLAGIRDADAKYKKRSAADQGKDKSGKVVDTKVDAGSTSYFLATARRPTEIQNVIDLPTILDKYKKQRQALAKRTWSLKSGRLGRHFLGRDDKLDDIAQDIEDKATDLQKHNLLDITSEITKDDDAGVNINDIRTACTNLKNHLSEVNKYYGSVIGTVCQLKRKLEVDSDDDDAADNIPEPSAPPADDKNSDLAKKKAKKQNGSAGRRTKSYLKQMYKVVKEFAAEESEKDRGKKTRLNDAMLATACAQFDGWYKSLSTRFSAENKSKAKDDLSFMPSDTSVSSPLDLAIDSDDAVFPTSGTPQMKVKDIPTAYAQLKRDIHTQDQLIKAIANQEYLFDDLEHGWANNLRSHIAAYLDRAILGGFSIIAARIAMRKMMGGSKTLVSGTVGVGTKTVDVRGIAECTKDLLKALGFSDGESGANTNGSSEVIPDCSTFFATEMPNLNNGKNIPNAINRCIFYRGNNEADDSSPNASTSDDSWATPDSTRIQAAIVTARNNLSQDKRAKLTDICIKIRTSLSTLYGRYFKLINENQIIGLHLVDGKIHAADTLARKELGLTKIALYNLLALMALARGHNSYGKVLHDKVTGVPSTLQGLLRAIDPEAGFNKYQSTFVDANGGAKMHAANKTAAQRLEYVTYTVGAAENTAHIKVENYKVLKNNNTDVDRKSVV